MSVNAINVTNSDDSENSVFETATFAIIVCIYVIVVAVAICIAYLIYKIIRDRRNIHDAVQNQPQPQENGPMQLFPQLQEAE